MYDKGLAEEELENMAAVVILLSCVQTGPKACP